MIRLSNFVLVVGLSFAILNSAWATVPKSLPRSRVQSFVKKNNVRRPTRRRSFARGNSYQGNGVMTERIFNRVLDKVEDFYKPFIEREFNVKFRMKRHWEDPEVNAYAYQEGDRWTVEMFGGLARHEQVTPDGFLLVACHEVGHHIGGAPTTSRLSNEGQSDYFATSKCFRKLFESMSIRSLKSSLKKLSKKEKIGRLVKRQCRKSHSSEKGYLICIRSLYGALSLGRLLSDLGAEPLPKYETPDPTKLSRTDDFHPSAQCRLDTSFHGALCTVGADARVDLDDPNVGYCSLKEDFPKMQVRPRCWYKPGDSASGGRSRRGMRRRG